MKWSLNIMENRDWKSFGVLVRKEIADYISSWKFVVLLLLILLTCSASLYSSLQVLRKSIPAPDDPNAAFFFLKIFTQSDGSLPSFHVFVGFLGPLLGICLGFDAVNSEFNNRSISRLLAQPIYRDSLLNAKFMGALAVIAGLFAVLLLLTAGVAILWTGLLPSSEEIWRLLAFLLLSVVYVGFWLNVSILFSTMWRHPATSALVSIAIWLFFTVFYPLIVNVVAQQMAPGRYASYQEITSYQEFIITLTRFAPNQLFDDATSTLLMPSIRSLGPLSFEQVQGAIPSPLPVWESVKVVWAQLTALLSITLLCFAASYYSFMRKEIRA